MLNILMDDGFDENIMFNGMVKCYNTIEWSSMTHKTNMIKIKNMKIHELILMIDLSFFDGRSFG